jgi:hypothetical protein
MLYPLVSFSLDVTLRWDANTEPDLEGYTIYWAEESGCPSGANSCSIPLGPYTHLKYLNVVEDENPLPEVVEYTITNLHLCIPWCFAVDAVDNQGLHSRFSNQVGLTYILNNVVGSKQ